MYNFRYHKENDLEKVKEFIAQNPFAFLTGCDADHKPIVTQVPTFLEVRNGKKILCGHIMKHTDHHKAFSQNPKVLAVFTGKHAYVSGSWYSNPNTASTWNYMSVHVKGVIRFLEGDDLIGIMRKTTLHFEGNNADSPTVFDNLPDDFKQRALPMIAGFEIIVEEIDTVFKLSQDRDAESYENIISKLKTQNEDGRVIAEEMEKRKKDLYG